jgi:ABC-2 type transport system ATP-binding protein
MVVSTRPTLVVPSGGKAFVAGIDVIAHPALVKQVIGVVSQTNNLDRALTWHVRQGKPGGY